MQVLIPHVCCLATHNEFEEAVKAYSEVYVPVEGGYLRHVKLRGGRHVRLKVRSLPKFKGVEIAAPPELKEELNFLPAGKIPMDFLRQIVTFFKEVMVLKRAEMEAHCWILWSPDKGYHISIPRQIVSKGSVEFSYNKEDLPDDCIIVVDLHSHNTMGAYFSGTDDRNDAQGVYYSIVVGKLKDLNPEITCRFNLGEVKRKVSLEEIFFQADIDIPKEWLDQVEVKTYVPKVIPTENPRTSVGQAPSLTDELMELMVAQGMFSREALLKDVKATLSPDEERAEELLELATQKMQERVDEAGNVTLTESEDPVGGHDDEYNYYAINYGVTAAEAYEQIEAYLVDLSECSEGILSLMREMYNMLDEDEKMKLATTGF